VIAPPPKNQCESEGERLVNRDRLSNQKQCDLTSLWKTLISSANDGAYAKRLRKKPETSPQDFSVE
jgi:hypothetical protein